jgi:hypothetical protein
MLAFYHLQQLSYLRTHDLIPTALPLPSSLLSLSRSGSSPSSGKPRRRSTVNINDAAVATWSSRLWAAYVVLQLAHLREDRALLRKRQRALNRLSPSENERAELARRWDAWYNELVVNLSYLPMTIHWYAFVIPYLFVRPSIVAHVKIQPRSLEKGLFKDQVNESPPFF